MRKDPAAYSVKTWKIVIIRTFPSPRLLARKPLVSGTGATRVYTLSSITASTTFMTFGNIQGSDSSSLTGSTIVLDPKTALTFDDLADIFIS